jgi:hypothetical protein
MEVRSLEVIVRALNEANVQYLIVGGLAVVIHGYQSFTDDVDLVIGLEPVNISKGLHALIAAGYKPAIPVSPEEFADARTRETWRRDKKMLVLKMLSDEHRRTPLDIFVYEPFDFAVCNKRARLEEVAPGLTAPFVDYDTLVEMKQSAGRSQDLADIQELRAARSSVSLSDQGGPPP